jgi:hypothetical protein
VLGIPGDPLVITDEGNPEPVTVKGLDPAYLRGRCSTGNWRATGAFELGKRQHPSGIPTSPSIFLKSNAFDLPCEGRKGQGKLQVTSATGPKIVRKGQKVRYRVGLRNRGTATVKPVTLKVTGPATGKAGVGKLAPGQTKQVTVSVRVSAGAETGKLRFKASGPGVSAVTSTKMIAVG